MKKEQMKKEIQRLKKEKNAVLLVHNYQIGDIQDLADHLGDSLGLSRIAASVKKPLIVFCGVRFMAETAKILSPDKKVLLPHPEAGCPMAQMVDIPTLKKLKSEHPGAAVVTYVNSTAEVKAESDVCCTSANAVKLVQNLENDEIIFAPDRNLADYVQRFTDKRIIPWEGFCYVHERFDWKEIDQAKKDHPDAVLIVHPECPPEVIDEADQVLSTSGMLKFAGESREKKFLVGTEEGILYRLRKENPDKVFLSAGEPRICRGMKRITLEALYESLAKNQYEVDLPIGVMNRARSALEKMLNYV
jgi:quinolinate synthase